MLLGHPAPSAVWRRLCIDHSGVLSAPGAKGRELWFGGTGEPHLCHCSAGFCPGGDVQRRAPGHGPGQICALCFLPCYAGVIRSVGLDNAGRMMLNGKKVCESFMLTI